MDCVQVGETLSAWYDGESVDADDLAKAHVHCATCAGCAALATTLRRLRSVPAPRASQDLLERLNRIAIEEAASVREAAAALAAAAALKPAEPAEPPAEPIAAKLPAPVRKIAGLKRPAWLTDRFAGLAAAAAVVLITAGLTSAVVLSRGPAPAGEPRVIELDRGGDVLGAAPESDATAESADTMRAELAPPSYIALGAAVWVLDAAGEPDESTLTTAGVVTSSLEEYGAVEDFAAYYPFGEADVLWVLGPEGYLRFTRVVRTLGNSRFALQTGTPLPTFRDWPSLPPRFEPPESPDGSPTFTYFGVDDLGVSIYLPAASRVTEGFAVPPDTDPSDPAAGNPGWTWWAPLR